MKAGALLLLTLLPLAAHALDLTPHPATRELEGFPIPILQFRDGTRWINFQPPPTWASSGGRNELRFTPDENRDALMRLSLHELQPMAAATPETQDDLSKWARQFLPKEGADAAVAAVNASPFTLENRPSSEWIFRYKRAGTEWTHSIAVVQLNERQRLVLSLEARSAGFDALHTQAIASMFSWQPAD